MDIQSILKNMTLEEKVSLLQAKDDWHLNDMERLGVPSVTLTDGPSGVRMTNDETLPATAIPTESILSASWDTELVSAVGSMMAEECQEYGVGILLGPGANAKRSPLAGRNFEYYSEDPYLTGKLAAAMINGVQSGGVGTSLKHYVANDQETRRFTADVTVDERTLREMLLTPFEIAIKEAKPWTIMAAYPKLRGTHIAENSYVLDEVLRKEYGYEGVVLSDWGATVNKVASHQNGLDLETGTYARSEELLQAVKSGEISEEVLNTHVLRVLELIEKVVKGHKETKVNWEEHHALARKAASESIVLLKNEGNLLPLKEGAKVTVAGGFAKEPRFGGGGSSGMVPQQLDIPFDFISNMSDACFVQGYDKEEIDEALIAEACEAAEGKDAVIVFVGTTCITESEGSDRHDILLPESHVKLVKELKKVNTNIIVCNASGAAVDFGDMEEEAKVILHMGLAGEGGGAAIADILFGKTNPSGKLTETFPLCIENTPTYPEFPGYDDNITYHEGLMQGYRYYDTKKIPVRFPFGHGLSYTNFTYSNLRVSTRELHNGDTLTVTVDVTNTGSVDGCEVVQFYVSDVQSYLVRPIKELKGFSRVMLKARETKTVSVALDERAFAYYVPHLGRYAVESGTFRIMAAASSADIRLTEEIVFVSQDEVRLKLGMYNTMLEFYTDDRYSKATKQVYDMLQITEDSFLFPILASITLKNLPLVLRFLQIPQETTKKFQQMILNGDGIIGTEESEKR